MADTKGLVKEMVKTISATISAHDLAEGSLSFVTVNTSGWVEGARSKRLPTNCKNCGAPLHGHRCEYCDTEY